MTNIYREPASMPPSARPGEAAPEDHAVLEGTPERFGCGSIFFLGALVVFFVFMHVTAIHVDLTCTRGASCVVRETGLVFGHEVHRFSAADLRDADATIATTKTSKGTHYDSTLHLQVGQRRIDLPRVSGSSATEAVADIRAFVRGAGSEMSVSYGSAALARVFTVVGLLIFVPMLFMMGTSYRLALTEHALVVTRRRFGFPRRTRYALDEILDARASRGPKQVSWSINVKTAEGERCVATIDGDVETFMAQLRARITPPSAAPHHAA